MPPIRYPLTRATVLGILTALGLGAAPAGPAQSPPQRPRVTGIHHVAFRVTDAAAARQFYESLVGLSEHATAQDGRVIFSVGAHQYVHIEPGLPAGEDERLSHVAFGTPDVRALSRYLTARGVPVQQPAGRCAETAIRVSDPDGHPIEFVQVSWPPPPASTAEGRALSARLLHTGLVVRDEQAAHAFYRDILGFSEIWRGGRPEGVTSWVNMRLPDGTDYLEYMLYAKPPERRQRGSAHHVCLRVPDIQVAWNEVTARSQAAGRQLPSPPTVGVNGKWQLNLYDPDGSRVELMEPFTTR
jgi:catechol 2,3-dioxygenase-like lactoylglutathione lyase family enzyme